MAEQDNNNLEVTLFSEATIPTSFGSFLISVYRDNYSQDETVLISRGLETTDCPFVRLHSECFTGEVLGSLKCDCRDQLHLALNFIAKGQSGALLYLRQEGRGIGLGNKIKAYALQNEGANTIEANHQLGFATDLRDFSLAAAILKSRGIKQVELNTNNPQKIQSLVDHGIAVKKVVPSLATVNEHNRDYLKTKLEDLGHLLGKLF